MTVSKRRIVGRVVFYAISGCVALAVWVALAPHESNRQWRTAADIDTSMPISVPSTATDIHLHSYRRVIEYVVMIRFYDQVEACLEHARLVTGDNEGRSIADESPVRKDQYVRRAETRGFDFGLEGVEHGMVFGNGGSMTPIVWVDTEKGAFYYFMSD